MRLPNPVLAFSAITLSVLGFASNASAFSGFWSSEDIKVRFSTFNTSLNRSAEGELISDLSTPDNTQAKIIAEIIQRVRPDVLLLNEFDYDAEGQGAKLFQENYLGVSQNGLDPIEYPYVYSAPSNTGIPTGLDLDNNGEIGGGGDAFGFGNYPGQFGMLVYSKYPINLKKVRTFQNFLWRDMPGALLPDNLETPEPADFYSSEELAVFRLSSKSHWDLPIRIGRRTVHFLVSHPTPPVFDGEEDRNGRRNHDEIRFWADYVSNWSSSRYIYDDQGKRGGLGPFRAFVIAGDLNADPNDGDSFPGTTDLLLKNDHIQGAYAPASIGAGEQAFAQGAENDSHLSNPAFDTADFGEAPFGPGNLRVDYVLPSEWGLKIVDGGVFWPRSTDETFSLVGLFPFPSSDHRAVYLDVEVR